MADDIVRPGRCWEAEEGDPTGAGGGCPENEEGGMEPVWEKRRA